MKRILACTLIMPLAVSLTLFLTVITSTKAEASSVEAVRQKMLEEDHKKETEGRRAAEARHAKELRKAKEAGFIALSESEMIYADAAAYCKQQGGKLPQINNSAAWDGKKPPVRGVRIDGFGYGYRPWKEVGLPSDFYWTGSEISRFPGNLWLVNDVGGYVVVLDEGQSDVYRVVCVP